MRKVTEKTNKKSLPCYNCITKPMCKNKYYFSCSILFSHFKDILETDLYNYDEIEKEICICFNWNYMDMSAHFGNDLFTIMRSEYKP